MTIFWRGAPNFIYPKKLKRLDTRARIM